MGRLLAQQRENRVFDEEVVSIRVGTAKPVDAPDGDIFIQAVEQPVGFLVQLHRFSGFGAVFLRETCKPVSPAGVTAVYVCNRGKTGLEPPSVKEV